METTPHVIETQFPKYPRFVVRRLTVAQYVDAERLLITKVRNDAGALEDPMSLGFLDVACSACDAERGAPCNAIGGEELPHQARVDTAIPVRVGRAYRRIFKAVLIEPQPTNALFEEIEPYIDAVRAAFRSVLHVSGLTKEAQDQAMATFREGGAGASSAPAGIPDPDVVSDS